MKTVVAHSGGRRSGCSSPAHVSAGRTSCAPATGRSSLVQFVTGFIGAGSELGVQFSLYTVSLSIAHGALKKLILDKSICHGVRRGTSEMAKPRSTRRLP